MYLDGILADSKVFFAFLYSQAKDNTIDLTVSQLKERKKDMLSPGYLQLLLDILSIRKFINIDNGLIRIQKGGFVFNGRNLDASDWQFLSNQSIRNFIKRRFNALI